MKDPKIVVIGGGTGSFELLSGLKKYTPNLTALVSMADDGGSTGVLRDEYGVLPPGDIRKCLVALSRTPELRNLFDYRFSDGGLAGHSFGNLFLSTVEKMAGDFARAVELAGKLLNITGRVLPITLDNVTLVIEEANGRITRGQSQLNDKTFAFEVQRPTVRLEPEAHITPEAKQAILDADMIVIAPGSLYSSLAAALVVDGVAEAMAQSRAHKVFVCNLVSEHGQTDGFGVHDYAAEIERFLGNKVQLDIVLYNTHEPAPALLKRYKEEDRTWVPFDETLLSKQHYIAIGDDFVADGNGQRTLIRHNPDKIAAKILQLAKNRGRISKMNINKAIIMMAGYGTRRLPITKALEKCMLPVGNRPVVDYIVEDCIRAGITEFILVVGEEFDQVKRYYGHNQILEEYLEDKGKLDELEEIRHLVKKARFHYVVQDQHQPYGTATPVWLSRHLIKPDEKVLVLNGDAFFYREDGTSELADFLEQAEKAGTPSAILVNEVPKEEIHKYGMVLTEERDGKEFYKGIIEKPTKEQATTNLMNPGSYLFDPAIFAFVDKNIEQHFEGEHYLVDAINDYVNAGNDMAVIRAKGEYLDCGTTEAWLAANQRIIGSK